MRLTLLATVVLLPGLAFAQQRQQVLHDIPWYSAHTAERNATLKFCHASADRVDMADCQNAEAAATGAMVDGSAAQGLTAMLNSPAYWTANPIARAGELQQCAHPNVPGNQMALPYCNAARQSAGQAGTGR